MHNVVNVHFRLEKQREDAGQTLSNNGTARGPCVVLVGPTDSGKSTFARLLVAYAARQGRLAIFVDTDVGQGVLAPPGGVGAVSVQEKDLGVVNGFFKDDNRKDVLQYFYGHTSPGENVEAFKWTVGRVFDTVKQRQDKDKVVKASGVVVNTCGWVDKGTGYNLTKHIITKANATMVLVMGDDRLLNMLKKDLPRTIDILKINRSGGIVNRSKGTRTGARARRIKEYFYGIEGNFAPVRMQLLFKGRDEEKEETKQEGEEDQEEASLPNLPQVELYQVRGSQERLSKGLQSFGAEEMDEAVPQRITELSAKLKLSLIAITHNGTNVIGYFHLQDLDLTTNVLTVLAPFAGAIPDNAKLLVGGVKWLGA